ncbi:hypothetical protein HMPREF1544_02156 [Mucor circinelloides 1006PhL]|uniref:PH domain-containing protein n=1 Tax=Mucor circinelloides f. circinelloides (strain 1006PhL) TaxID=1220926 RepID=S2JRE3_MUCC1|nr:hypothetical protein HMPREF1544_02156 [Mucor circinelloides 1006PhL]
MLRFDNNTTIHSNINNAAAKAVAFPWLRKKTSSWSLRSSAKNIRLNSFSSTVSLPTSVASTTCSTSSSLEEGAEHDSTFIIPEEEEAEDQEQEEYKDSPPDYDDSSHPWTFRFPKSLSNRIIIPREEEGNEKLPDYECSIDKMSYMHVKCEFSKPNVRSKNRSWKDYYVVVYGTKITAYHRNPKTKKSNPPAWSHTMQSAQVTVASDYVKFRHVIRLKIHNGPQYLMTTHTDVAKNEWIAVLESSIHISSDLDVRVMPQFITLVSRRRRQRQRRIEQQQTTQNETLV